MDRVLVVVLVTCVAYWFGFQEPDTGRRIFLFTIGTLPWLFVLPRLVQSIIERRANRRLEATRDRLRRSSGTES